MQIKQKKVFEKPAGGVYLGTIVDVVDFPNHQSTYKGQVRFLDKVLVKWVLSHLNGQPYLDKEGFPFYVAGFYTASMGDNANLPKVIASIIQAPCPLIQDTKDIEALVLGRSSQLFVTSEPDQANPGEMFVKVAGITPLGPGMVPPRAPQGFVRQKDKPKQQAGPQGTPVNTYATREAAQAAAPNSTPVPAPISFGRPGQNPSGVPSTSPEAF